MSVVNEEESGLQEPQNFAQFLANVNSEFLHDELPTPTHETAQQSGSKTISRNKNLFSKTAKLGRSQQVDSQYGLDLKPSIAPLGQFSPNLDRNRSVAKVSSANQLKCSPGGSSGLKFNRAASAQGTKHSHPTPHSAAVSLKPHQGGQQLMRNHPLITVSKATEQSSSYRHPNLVKLPYRLASANEGAFAFKSKSDLMQPFYPLKFLERNLTFQLEFQEMQQRSKKQPKGASNLQISMRAWIARVASEAQQEPGKTSGSKMLTSNNEVSKLMKQFEMQKQTLTISQRSTIVSFQLNKVRYYDDHKFPFRLLKDVPKLLDKTMQQVRHSRYGESKAGQKGERSLAQVGYFLENNESAVQNMVVYLFWIVVSVLFDDPSHISFPPEFIAEVRQAQKDQYTAVYFNYLVRLRQTVMDSIVEILPFLLAETIRAAFQAKFKNHDLPLSSDKTLLQFCKLVFLELFGYETNDLTLQLGIKKFLKAGPSRHASPSNTMKGLQRRPSFSAQGSRMSGNLSQYGKQSEWGGPAEKLAKPKAHIFEAPLYVIKRDPLGRKDFNPKKVYSDEIKADLVNEMVKTFGKIEKDECKQTISDQINAMGEVPAPEQVLKLDQNKVKVASKRREAFSLRSHYSGIGSTLTLARRSSSSTRKNFASTNQMQHKLLGEQKASHGIPSQTVSSFAVHEGRKQRPSNASSINFAKTLQKRMSVVNFAPKQFSVEELNEISEENSVRPNTMKTPGSLARKLTMTRDTSTVSAKVSKQVFGAQRQPLEKSPSLIKAIRSTKKTIKKSKIEDPSKQTIEILGKIVTSLEEKPLKPEEDSGMKLVERRVQSALAQRQSDSRTQHLSQSTRKFKTNDSKIFQLQYMTPTVNSHFSGQLVSSHYPERKQKNLIVQSAASLTQEFEYKAKIEEFLRFKKAVNTRKEKLQEQERRKAEADATKALMNEQSQRELQFSYAREGAAKKQEAKEAEKAHQEMMAARKNQKKTAVTPPESLFSSPSITALSTVPHAPVNQKRSAAMNRADDFRSTAMSALSDFKAAPTLADTKAPLSSRNVRFGDTDGNITETLGGVNPSIVSNLKAKGRKKPSFHHSQSMMNVNKHVFFFQDADYFDAQKTWELGNQRDDKLSKGMRNSDIVYSQSELAQKLSLNKRNSVTGPDQKLCGPAAGKGIMKKPGKKELNTDKVQNEQPAFDDFQLKMTKSQSMQSSVVRQRQYSTLTKQSSTVKPTTVPFLSAMEMRAHNTMEADIELPAPFSERDLGMQMTRKTTRIIREGKSVTTNDGKLHAPMHAQYHNFLKQYPDKAEEEDKKLVEEEIVRKRIDDALPASIKANSNWIKKRAAAGYLADKHTYSTMRKISSTKSRKMFIFDSYTAKQKQEDTAIANSKENLHEVATPQADSAAAKDKAKSTEKVEVKEGAATKDQIKNNKSYYAFKGSHFKKLELSPAEPLTPVEEAARMSKRQYTKPPKPVASQAKKSAMLHTMKLPSTSLKEHNPQQQQVHSPARGDQASRTHTRGPSEDISVAISHEDLENMTRVAQSKQEFDKWQRYVQLMNENDDKADVRDGIAQTKSTLIRINTDPRTLMRLVPREHNTKLYKMLKQLRGFLKDEQVMKQHKREQNGRDMKIEESEEEKERHEGDDEVCISRPNPLELQPKKKKKQVETNKDSKGKPGGPPLAPYGRQFKQQKEKLRSKHPDIAQRDRRHKPHFD